MPHSPALDPELAQAVAAFPGGIDPGAHLGDPNVVRLLRSTMDMLGALGGTLPVDERVSAQDRSIPGPGGEIPVRVYTPVERGDDPVPALVFFHGGAFVICDRYTEELRCLRYAAETPCVVVSIDYRLAPEHPYPAGVDDCYAGLEWTVANAAALGVDPTRVGVGGSSAGGALAAAVALMARDRGGPALAVQILNYPVIDDRMQTPSMRAFDTTPIWTNTATADMWQHYLGDPDQRGDVSPTPRPDAPPTSPACRPRMSSPPSSTPCATRASSTRSASWPPVCPRSCTPWPAPATGSTSSGRAPRWLSAPSPSRCGPWCGVYARLTADPRAGTPGHETVEKRPGRARHVVDGALEGGPVGLGRGAVAADLPDVLQGCRPHVLVGNGVWTPEGHDASAHPDTVPHRCTPVPAARGRRPAHRASAQIPRPCRGPAPGVGA